MEDIVYPTLGREDLNLTVETGIHLFILQSFFHFSFILSFILSLILPSSTHFYVHQSFHPFKHLPILYSVYHSNPNMLSRKTPLAFYQLTA